jgi:hypothetical protein
MSNTYHFIGGKIGLWRVLSIDAIRGTGLASVTAVDVRNNDSLAISPGAAWTLRGFTSNLRYATQAETMALKVVQPALNRPEATHAALIPIKKSNAWWELAQDERRAIFEESSHHTAIGLEYLPAVARRLHHCRDLGEPFDFLTWFEFAAEHESAFDNLLARLRQTREWGFVEREVEIRLERLS